VREALNPTLADALSDEMLTAPNPPRGVVTPSPAMTSRSDSTQRNQYKTVFQKKQEYAQSISKIHQAERSNLESEDLWLAKYIGMVMIVEGTTRIVTSVEFSHGKNAWILKAQKAKQSEYDDREYLPEQGGDVCEIDVKTHGKTSSNAYIKAFNAHYASLHNSN
jgi:hypothetical protein